VIRDLTWRLKRLHQIARRLQGSIALRGWRSTLRRVTQEFRQREASNEVLHFDISDASGSSFQLATSDTPVVSVIMSIGNASRSHTLASLRSIAQHGAKAPFEVIVIEDADADHLDTDPLIDIQGLRRLTDCNTQDFARACHFGARAARGEFLLFLDSQLLVGAGWIDALIACFNEEPDCYLASARIVTVDGRPVTAGVGVDSDGKITPHTDSDEPWIKTRRRIDSFIAGAWMIRRERFLSIGVVDPDYMTPNYLVADLSMTVRADGGAVYCVPAAMVGCITPAVPRKDLDVERDRSLFAKKWHKAIAEQHKIGDTATFISSDYPRRMLVVDTMMPNPYRDAGSLRLCLMLRILHQDGWRVDLLSDDGHMTATDVTLLGEYGITAHSGHAATWLRMYGQSLDAIILCRLSVAAQYLSLSRRLAPQALCIFDTVDLHFLREQRAAELSGSRRMRQRAATTKRQELALIRDSDFTFVVSDAELNLLAKELPGYRIELLSTIHEVHGRHTGFDTRHGLLFIGGFGHPPNADAMHWFINEIMPSLHIEEPELQLHIVGDISTEARKTLSRPGIEIHGRVDDIAPLMDTCKVSVAPLRFGAGVKGKVNMAMSYGLPVVVTSLAAEGMHLSDGHDALIADDAEDFVRAILRVYRDKALWMHLSESGLMNVKTHFSLDKARQTLRKVLPSAPISNNGQPATIIR